MNLASMRVALLYGGVGAEAAVSRASASAVREAMTVLGITPIEIDVKGDYIAQLQAHRPTHAFNLVHGRPGEDGVLQGVCCALNIPFTGSGVAASALCLDKPKTKQIWQALGMPTAPMAVVQSVSEAAHCVQQLGESLFVKPAHEGSSVGAYSVTGQAALERALHDALSHDREVLVEPCLPGPEYTVGILKGRALPVIGIRPAGGFYDYTAKYEVDTTQYAIPSGLSPSQEAEAQALAIRAFDALGCRTWGRIDFMADAEGALMLVECNTVPGMTDHSLVPKAARAAGIEMPELVEQILMDAEVSL